ncbi:GyrI-like domain-containing protein [Sedimentibacter sp. zth1]|uniref:GyrI-like domain-containing protein n=1 Tax=Sedimentibacter sp. zth1 TaxID=2816908 RepID=UPI001A92903B|nr:GyrI-like domain-containing protein [Sedimentibacter sp. zth1]QSX04993.1 GyrI-like domain-containing protein [Sedimentibacter sp. zth1]
MEIKKCIMQSFSVIGKEGSTNDGNNFVENLWVDANSHFDEVKALAKKDANGNIVGIWGLMSDFSRTFKPWDNNFSEGLYLAGVQTDNNATPPENWVKWTVPSFEYLYAKVEEDYNKTFNGVLQYMNENKLNLAGAVFDFNCPEENGQLYLFFPIKCL